MAQPWPDRGPTTAARGSGYGMNSCTNASGVPPIELLRTHVAPHLGLRQAVVTPIMIASRKTLGVLLGLDVLCGRRLFGRS
jgi:hypothetical protein